MRRRQPLEQRVRLRAQRGDHLAPPGRDLLRSLPRSLVLLGHPLVLADCQGELPLTSLDRLLDLSLDRAPQLANALAEDRRDLPSGSRDRASQQHARLLAISHATALDEAHAEDGEAGEDAERGPDPSPED